MDKLRIPNLDNRSFYVFGAGDIGRGLYVTLSKFDMFAGFIDNSGEKQISGFCGEIVHSYEWYLENAKEETIIIAANSAHEQEISRQLKQDNCTYYYSEGFLNRIFPLYMFYKKNLLFMNLAQICVTERCTLKCADCAHACYAVDRNTEDMRLEDVYNSADLFFSKVDYIHEFVLIGGEPLLYADLEYAVRYIGDKYRDKIGTFSITTNGTILPGRELLDSCQKYGVLVRISNYTRSIPALHDQYEKLEKLLAGAGVLYNMGKEDEEWWDYGFANYIDEGEEKEIIRKFDLCATPCRETRNGRLYFCVMARTVSDNLGYHIGEEDFLDLTSLPEGDLGRKLLLEFNMGYSEKGYLSMCRRCHGSNSKNYVVPAARQRERN
ncbi:MAG: radical SAM protein [Roseburia sp.]|nr:radical SAM protein [Roseburia sp.]